MRRLRSITTVAAVTALALAGTACGVLANTTAATVAGRSISIETLEQLARDEGFVREQVLGKDESRIPGDLFRSLLLFELQRNASIAEAQRWGLDLDTATARRELDAQLQTAGLDYDKSTIDLFEDYYAAQMALQQRFAELDPTNEDDLRLIYDGVPHRWERTCVVAVGLPPTGDDAALAEQDAAVAKALDGAGTVEDLPEAVPGAQLATDPENPCIRLVGVPEELQTAFEAAKLGVDSDPVTVDLGMNGDVRFVFRIDEHRTMSFDDARDELEQLAQSLVMEGPIRWINLIVQGAEIDPRFGSGVVSEPAGSDPEGAVLVVPPPGPLAGPAPAEDPFALVTDTAP